MRRLAAGVAGAFAVLVMMLMQPWERLECQPPVCHMGSIFGTLGTVALGIVLYLAFPLVVVGIIQVAVLGIRDSSRPHDLAVRAALGETGARAVRAAALRGLRDGGVVAAAAYLIGGIAQVAILARSGWPLTTEGTLWYARLVAGVLVAATLAVAHVVDAARPRRTPTERLFEDARPVAKRRGARLAGIVLAAAAALASGVVAGLAIAYDLAPSFYVTNAAGIAFAVAIVAMLGLALVVLIPASRRAVPWVLTRVSSRMRGAAGAILASRSGAVTRAGGRVVLVLGSFGFLLGAATSMDTSADLSPTYVGYVSFSGAFDAAAFEDELRDVDGVAAVVMPPARNVMDPNGNPTLLFALDPAALRGLDDGLARLVANHPKAVAQYLWNGSAQLHLGPDPQWSFDPTGVVLISRCCEMFTSAGAGMTATPGVVAYLVYSTEPALNGEVGRAITSMRPADLPAGSWTDSSVGQGGELARGSVLASIAVVAAFVGTPLAALGVGLVRTRRRDDATLAAMGAPEPSIRTALVVETAVVAAFAMVVGTTLGALTRASATALGRARSSLTGVITDSYLAAAFGSVAWVALGIAAVGSVAVVAITAWIAASVRRRATPVDGLAVEKSGVLS